VAHHTEGINPPEEVDAAGIGSKLVDLTRGDLIGRDLSRTVNVTRELQKKTDLGKAAQKSADAVVGGGMRSLQLKG